MALTGFVLKYPHAVFGGWLIASIANGLGSMVTFAMGHAGRKIKSADQVLSANWLQRLQRWGPALLILAWLPIVGDGLCLAAGWLKMPRWYSFVMILLGKALRYALIILLIDQWPA
ncbi:YqaA family protein [Pokkaliibacter sp. CJK22405]|uniref:YqaA family protein n=1 Tax=Pokkaliibacter sp. CJK22405 TaxID=3384615 RepID=UPI0039848931